MLHYSFLSLFLSHPLCLECSPESLPHLVQCVPADGDDEDDDDDDDDDDDGRCEWDVYVPPPFAS